MVVAARAEEVTAGVATVVAGRAVAEKEVVVWESAALEAMAMAAAAMAAKRNPQGAWAAAAMVPEVGPEVRAMAATAPVAAPPGEAGEIILGSVLRGRAARCAHVAHPLQREPPRRWRTGFVARMSSTPTGRQQR